MNNTPPPGETIRIGTLAGKGPRTAEYIQAILPHGFESFQINFWQNLQGTDLKKLADELNAFLPASGAVVSSLGMFGNPLGDQPIDEETRKGWEACIDNAHLFGCNLVCGFAGRVRHKPVPESIPVFKKVFGELVKRAADKGVRIAFENCQMGGSWATGDWNIAFNPTAWTLMFDAVNADNIGLEWEPCHQMTQLIDPLPQLREWIGKVFHVHGKDASIYRDVISRHGLESGRPWVEHRTPGFGDTDWTTVIGELRRGGYEGAIDIEGWHDPIYQGSLEMTGQVHALEYLRRCRTRHVANPAGF